MARGLSNAGYDSLHVRDYGIQDADDDVILERAAIENRTVITADTDYGNPWNLTATPGARLLRPRRTLQRLALGRR